MPRKPDVDFALLPAYSADFAAAVMEREVAFREYLSQSRLISRMKRSWGKYNSRGQDGGVDDTEITAGGERGELLRVVSNRYARLVGDQLVMVQQTPPDYQPETINTDPESQAQARLALGILDQYKRTHRLGEFRAECAEMAAVLGAAFAHIRWDVHSGKPAMVGEDGTPINEGDHVFSCRSIMDVAYERNARDKRRPAWWIVREPMLRADAQALYGNESEEIATAISRAPSYAECNPAKDFISDRSADQYDDSIAVFHVYVERSPGRPNGRTSVVLDEKTVLLDGALGEDRAPVFGLYQKRVMLTGDATNSNFDGLPLQQAFEAQMSTVASNHSNFGLTRVQAARKSNINARSLERGIGIVDFDHFDPGSGAPVPEPKVMPLNTGGSELFTFAEAIMHELDFVLRGSPVLRGDPDATKGDSGSKTAMLFAAAQGASGGFLRNVLSFDEEIATHLISSVQRNATVPRVTSIVGDRDTYTSRRFTGRDVQKIYRINVRQADPARDTFQGKFAAAELIAGKPVDEQERLLSILETGRTEPATEDLATERMLVERENEQLRNVTVPPPVVLGSDRHQTCHIGKHRAQLAAIDVRNNPQARQRIEKHIAEHIGALTPGHPSFAGMHVLAVCGEKPLPPLDTAMGGASPAGQAEPAEPSLSQQSGGGGSPMPKPPSMPDMPDVPGTGAPPNVAPPNVSPPAGAGV